MHTHSILIDSIQDIKVLLLDCFRDPKYFLPRTADISSDQADHLSHSSFISIGANRVQNTP